MIADPRRRRQAEVGARAGGGRHPVRGDPHRRLVSRLKCPGSAERGRRRTARGAARTARRRRPAPALPATTRSHPGGASGGAREWRRTAGSRCLQEHTPARGILSRPTGVDQEGPGQRQDRQAAEEDQRGLVAVRQQVEQCPQGDAPHERVARDADHADGRRRGVGIGALAGPPSGWATSPRRRAGGRPAASGPPRSAAAPDPPPRTRRLAPPATPSPTRPAPRAPGANRWRDSRAHRAGPRASLRRPVLAMPKWVPIRNSGRDQIEHWHCRWRRFGRA